MFGIWHQTYLRPLLTPDYRKWRRNMFTSVHHIFIRTHPRLWTPTCRDQQPGTLEVRQEESPRGGYKVACFPYISFLLSSVLCLSLRLITCIQSFILFNILILVLCTYSTVRYLFKRSLYYILFVFPYRSSCPNPLPVNHFVEKPSVIEVIEVIGHICGPG